MRFIVYGGGCFMDKKKIVKENRGVGVPLVSRGLLLFLSFVMIFNLFPFTASAANGYHLTKVWVNDISHNLPYTAPQLSSPTNVGYGTNFYEFFNNNYFPDIITSLNQGSSGDKIKFKIVFNGDDVSNGYLQSVDFHWGDYVQRFNLNGEDVLEFELQADTILNNTTTSQRSYFYFSSYCSGSNIYGDIGINSIYIKFDYETQSLLNNILGWLSQIKSSILGLPSSISGFFTSLGDRISGFFTTLSSSLSTWWSNLTTSLGNWFTSVGNWFSNLGDRISGFFSGLGDRISGFFSGLWSDITSLVVPPDDFDELLRDDVDDVLSTNLGFLYQLPPAVLQLYRTLQTRIATSNTQHVVRLTFPAIKVPLIDGSILTICNSVNCVFRQSDTVNGVFGSLYYYDGQNGFQRLWDLYQILLSAMWLAYGVSFTFKMFKYAGLDIHNPIGMDLTLGG